MVIGLCFLTSCSPEEVVHETSGKEKWEKSIADFEATGFQFGFDDLIPEPVPDEENFAAIPMLNGITDPDDPKGIKEEGGRDPYGNSIWNGVSAEMLSVMNSDLDEWLRLWAEFLTEKEIPEGTEIKIVAETVLNELNSEFGEFFAQSDAALDRKYSQFVPCPSEFLDRENPYESGDVAYLIAVFDYSKTLGLRAVAAAACGKRETAYKSLMAMIRLAEAVKFESTGVIGLGSRGSLCLLAVVNIIRAHQFLEFDSFQTGQIIRKLEGFDFVEDFIRGVHAEAVTLCTSFGAFHEGHSALSPDDEVERINAPENIDEFRAELLTVFQAQMLAAREPDIPKLKTFFGIRKVKGTDRFFFKVNQINFI